MWADRILGWADEDDRSHQAQKVRGLQVFLQMHISARLWFICLEPQAEALLLPIGMASAATLACLVGLRTRWVRVGIALTTATMLVKLAVTFPMSSNHFAIELLNVLLLLGLDTRSAADRRLLLVATRWITAIVLFHTGLQKVLYGTYFHGEFLAYAIATRDTFGDVFRLALPAEEFSRLANSHPERFGSGPFVVQSPLFLLISNGVYLFEMAAPVLLMLRKTRTLVVFAVIAFMLFVQAGAREVFFALLMVQLLLLFLNEAWNQRLLPGFAAAYAALLGTRYFFPEVPFF